MGRGVVVVVAVVREEDEDDDSLSADDSPFLTRITSSSACDYYSARVSGLTAASDDAVEEFPVTVLCVFENMWCSSSLSCIL